MAHLPPFHIGEDHLPLKYDKPLGSRVGNTFTQVLLVDEGKQPHLHSYCLGEHIELWTEGEIQYLKCAIQYWY